jgi:amino acid transporter
VIWRGLAKTHKVQQTPFVASIVQTLCGLAVILISGLKAVDPLQVLLPWASVIAAVGIVAVQAFASLSVVGFFWKDSRGVSLWQRAISPAVASLGLFLCLWQIIVHVHLLSGSTSVWSTLVPWATLAVGVAGMIFACWLRRARPTLYNSLGRLLNEI